MNLSTLSLSALQKIEKELPEAIRSAKAREIERAREAVSRALKDTGFTLADLAGVKAKGSLKGIKVAPKYSNGNGKTWTGRGRAPKWMGKNKDKWESMLI